MINYTNDEIKYQQNLSQYFFFFKIVSKEKRNVTDICGFFSFYVHFYLNGNNPKIGK
jgi:hypothetical protein